MPDGEQKASDATSPEAKAPDAKAANTSPPVAPNAPIKIGPSPPGIIPPSVKRGDSIELINTKSRAAMQHLKCLLGFIDSDILTKSTYLNHSRRVFFSDLWHLFKPGMEVIGADGKQAYRVIGVRSERHRVDSAEEWWAPAKKRRIVRRVRRGSDTTASSDSDDEDRAKKFPLHITCVYIDFDGKHIGPVTKVFGFRRFEGQRDVTSLEVYPLQHHPVRASDFADVDLKDINDLPVEKRYREKLIRRGKKFLEVAMVKHMYYSGLTVEVQEEVESQVVVDFDTAFSMEDELHRDWRPELENLIGSYDDDSDSDDSCSGTCCEDDFVHDDSRYVDTKLRTEYIDGLLPRGRGSDEQPSIALISRPLKELQTGEGGGFDVTEEELVIMSYRVFGFVLRSRRWGEPLPSVPNQTNICSRPGHILPERRASLQRGAGPVEARRDRPGQERDVAV